MHHRLIALLLAATALAVGCTSAQLAAPVTEAAPTEATADGVVAAEPTALPTAVPDPAVAPIRLGVAMAETGVMAEFDRAAVLGMRWQVDRINAAGGVLGRDLVLEVRDTESRLSVTKRASEELLELGVGVLFVSCDAAFARPAIDEANARGVLTISPCGPDLFWAEAALGPLSFSFGNSALLEGAAMADQAADAQWFSAVVFADTTNPSSLEQCRGFSEQYVNVGGGVIGRYEYSYEDLARLEQRISEQPVPASAVVVLCSHLPGGVSGGPATLDLLRASGVTAPVLVGSQLDAPGWLRSVADLGSVAIVTQSSVYGDDPTLLVNQMIAELGDTSGLNVRGWTIYGADAIEGYARALERTGELQGLLIAQQLEAFDSEPLVSGPVSFSAESHMDPNRILRVLETTGTTASFVTSRVAGEAG